MEALYKRELYGETMALAIEAKGSTAVSIANRWALGWPDRVRALLAAGVYGECLERQTETEKDALAETYAPHLSTIEVLQLNEVSLYPPFLG
ncbi:hypothetical protein [Roseateles sp.]|uniref:hypothetical protein n=1 Tax=Roseateles sp. TaxID=1971397 RepID=UPI003BA96D61